VNEAAALAVVTGIFRETRPLVLMAAPSAAAWCKTATSPIVARSKSTQRVLKARGIE